MKKEKHKHGYYREYKLQRKKEHQSIVKNNRKYARSLGISYPARFRDNTRLELMARTLLAKYRKARRNNK